MPWTSIEHKSQVLLADVNEVMHRQAVDHMLLADHVLDPLHVDGHKPKSCLSKLLPDHEPQVSLAGVVRVWHRQVVDHSLLPVVLESCLAVQAVVKSWSAQTECTLIQT